MRWLRGAGPFRCGFACVPGIYPRCLVSVPRCRGGARVPGVLRMRTIVVRVRGQLALSRNAHDVLIVRSCVLLPRLG